MQTCLKLIQSRRSCRSFLSKSVSEVDITAILKAGLWSPTSKNNRPWEFVVVEKKETIQALSTCKPHGAAFLSGAPVAIVIMADPSKSDVWVEDCSISAILMQMTTEDLGLGSTWIQVRNRLHSSGMGASAYVKEIIQAPQHLEVAAILAIGHKEKERLAYAEDDLHWNKVRFLK
jgi:nitroreductase